MLKVKNYKIMKMEHRMLNRMFYLMSRTLLIVMILSFIDAIFLSSSILNLADKTSDSIGFLWYIFGIPGRFVSFLLTPFLGLWSLWFSIGQLSGIAILLYLNKTLSMTNSTE